MFKKTLSFFLLFFCSSLCSENAAQPFSEQEKEHVSHIMHHLFKFDHFSYTLFSDKPISFECFWLQPIKDAKKYCTLLSYQRPLNILETSWNLWQSRFSDFQFKNYLFFEKRTSEMLTIILINKNAFSKAFLLNQNLFKDLFGKDITEQKLLDRIQSSEFSLYGALNNNEEVLGIFLGFGNCNAKLYRQRSDFSNNYLLNPEFKKNRISRINQKLKSASNSFHYIYVVPSIGFSVDHSQSETHQLLKKYSQSQRKASKLLRDSQWIDVIISRLME